MTDETLGVRVKKLREAAGLSQQALAHAAGLSMSVIFQIEQGAKSDPRSSTIVALAKALQVDAAILLGLKPMPETSTESTPEEEKPTPSKKSPVAKETPPSAKRKK